MTRGFFAACNDHDDFLRAGRKVKITGEAAGIEAFHGASVEAERFSGDDETFACEWSAFGGPLEQTLAGDGRHANDFEESDGAEGEPFESAKQIAPTLNKEAFGKFRFAFVLGDFFGGETGGTHPGELIECGGAPGVEVGNGDQESGSGFGRRLAEAEMRDGAAGGVGLNPEESIGLDVEAGGGEAGGVEKLVTESGGDFNGIEDADGAALSDSGEGWMHGDLHVAITTY